jgi:NADPH:quinone reductase-like Zn-dependent oxidoreductase
MPRIVEFASFGTPEVLKFKEVSDPRPAAGEVRIRVKAIGLNRAESMWRHDEYIETAKLPARLGYEAAGTVDALGRGVEGFEIGEPVNVIPNFSMNEYATYGELIVMPVGSIVKQPASLSFVEGASIWMMFVTAYSALIKDAKVSKGDFVIIPAASSSVGLAAVQIVNYAGATSIALTRTSNKRKQLLEAGAAQVIATAEVDFVREVMRRTDGKGARVVFDPVGGPNFPKLISALASQGILYIYGALSENVTPLPVLEKCRSGAGDRVRPDDRTHSPSSSRRRDAERGALNAPQSRNMYRLKRKPLCRRSSSAVRDGARSRDRHPRRGQRRCGRSRTAPAWARSSCCPRCEPRGRCQSRDRPL